MKIDRALEIVDSAAGVDGQIYFCEGTVSELENILKKMKKNRIIIEETIDELIETFKSIDDSRIKGSVMLDFALLINTINFQLKEGDLNDR